MAMFEQVRATGLFSEMFAWTGGRMSSYEAGGVKYAASVSLVAGDFFSTLGVQPLLGTLIRPSDAALHTGVSAPVGVLDYRCWKRRYQGDPTTIGKAISIDGHPLTITGVAPENFTGCSSTLLRTRMSRWASPAARISGSPEICRLKRTAGCARR